MIKSKYYKYYVFFFFIIVAFRCFFWMDPREIVRNQNIANEVVLNKYVDKKIAVQKMHKELQSKMNSIKM